MPGSNATAAKLAITGGGALLLWSAVKGKKWTEALRDLISGKPPALASTTSIISPSPGSDGGTGSSGSGGVTPSGPGEIAWITAFLTSIGAPPTQANIKSMSAWISRETPWPPVAKNNPMNTTQKMPGSTNFNSVGVQNYPTAAEGIAALRMTITNGRYSGIVSALRSGKGICGGGLGGEFSTWSGGGYSAVC